MAIVSAENLSKSYPVALKDPGLAGTLRHFLARRYRQIEAVKGVSFQIEPGEIVGFLGPNGAGKTTTLKMLTGLIHPTAGRVEVAGHLPFRREAEFLRKITLVMGNKQQLIWDLPAGDSFAINAAVYEIPDAELKKRVGELAEMLGLGGKLTQPVRKLSLGERMKAELLAALLHRPQVLFLDEPTLGLDVNAQNAVREFLREYNRRYGATILLTSHYMADITALAERVLLIHRGSLIYDGGLQGLLERFAPYREVRLELERPVSRETFERYGEVAQYEVRQARLLLRRETLVEGIAQILKELPVADLEVREPAVEEVIGRVFESGAEVEAPRTS
ncbi:MULTISPECIES: ATP-binding cassette domain-containing protein [unclassified Meiothermus]|uniref:ABC transporter ATP-binding protein n=1 Tax=unclassified Meiothermus TaxID=370471 RepID=UPI000D7CA72E|nr:MULTISPECIES: ATP-binding cassette domain-containing protein [unclassified Meiothermus]PZA06849.1 ABC transporter [Meiothermus sp. Pnk-1]RYM33172.1 ATP-binding cassette domain-containing protein [Meiothermus sp. PNK-Is4]